LLVENEQDLLATYGKPLDKDGQFEYWMTASSYLSYGGVLRVLRSDNSSLRNAGVGTVTGEGPKGDDGVKIKSYDDYTEYHTSGLGWFFAAKNPGTWGNGLKVFTIDHFADQVITGIATTGTGTDNAILVGMGITQSITGRTRVDSSGITTTYSGFMRGIITGVGVSEISVRVVDRIQTDGITTSHHKTNYDQLQFIGASIDVVSTPTTTSIGATNGIVAEPNISKITGITTQTGVQAVASVQTSNISGGSLTGNLNISEGGSGYKEAPTVTISGGGGSAGIGTATIVGGTVTNISVGGGSGYTTIPSVALSAPDNGLSQDIAIGDNVTVTGGNSTVASGTKVVSIGIGTITVDKTISGISTVGAGATFIFTRTEGTTTTRESNTMFVIDKDGDVVGHAGDTGIGTITKSTVKDWYNSQTLGLSKGGDISWNSIAEKPGTSEYALSRESENDEIHVVVIDEDGSATGIAGNIVEKFLYLSKAKDGKRQPSEEVYYKNYLANVSEFIYAGLAPTSTDSGQTVSTSLKDASSTEELDDFTITGGGQWGQNTAGVIFDVQGNKSFSFKGGKDYSTRADGLGNTTFDGYQVDKGDVINSYNILRNPAEYDINFIIQGPSGGGTIFDAQAKASALISIANLRKDCIACISPHRSGIVNIANSDKQTDALVEFYRALQSSSYAVFDSGYKYTFDRFNNEFRYIPLNGDIAGLMARTSINSFSWFSPAGASRGAINGAIKLAYNPTQAQRDIIYPKRINPVIASPGAGIILFGDRTGLGVASAFDRINVRRLFLTLEDVIERAARDQLFEFNDIITRTNFLNIVDPFLRDVKAKRGITDFVVICDETNNTPAVIDANQFKADIFIKPARSINFIGLTFVATRTGVSFEEVVGNV